MEPPSMLKLGPGLRPGKVWEGLLEEIRVPGSGWGYRGKAGNPARLQCTDLYKDEKPLKTKELLRITNRNICPRNRE
jgi:hypothetical protein